MEMRLTMRKHLMVSAWVASEDHKVTILMTNHAMPRHPIKTELVHFRLDNAPRPLTAYIERIDDVNANAYRAWREIGRPQYLSSTQVKQLEAASAMTKRSQPLMHRRKKIDLEIALSPHSVAAVTIEVGNE